MTWIVFEGSEGVGKSTQIELLFEHLLHKKISTIKTREPGGTPIAEEIRNLFKAQFEPDDQFLKLTEFFLISAARNEHFQKVIQPYLNKKFILCDRFLDSTYVYQNILGGVPKKTIDSATSEILKGQKPDVTFVLTCNQKIAMNRIQKNREMEKDRFDNESLEFHEKLLKSYEKIVHENYTYPCGSVPLRILIPTDKEPATIFENILFHLNTTLGLSL